MKHPSVIRRDLAKKVALAVLVVTYLALIHFRGIIFSDEGYILSSAWRMMLGQVPYRDFEMVYTPVSFLAVFGAFRLLGESVFSGRVLMLFCSTVTFGFIFRIIRRFSRSFVVATLGSLTYLVWGPGQINFPWPTMFAITLGVVTTFFLLKGKRERRFTLLAGAFAMLTFLAKQNLGLGLLVADTLYLAVLFRRKLWGFLVGAGGGLGIWLIYLFSNGAVGAFFDNLYFHTLQKIIVEGTISTAFVTPADNLLATILKSIFYGLPLIVGILAVMVIGREKKWTLLPIPILGLVFYLFGIRPVTDYNHFVPLLAISGLSLAILNRFTRTPIIKFVVVIVLVGLSVFGFYQSLWGGHYRWDKPLVTQNVYITNSRVKVWATEDYLKQVTDLSKFFDERTNTRDKIFVNVYLPMVYFVTNRQNATRFDYFSDTATSKEQQIEMVADLKKARTKYVVNNFLNLNDKSKVNMYLQQDFIPVASSGAFVFLERLR